MLGIMGKVPVAILHRSFVQLRDLSVVKCLSVT